MKKLLVIGSISATVLVGGLWLLNRGPSDVSSVDSAKLSSPVGTLVAGVSSSRGANSGTGTVAGVSGSATVATTTAGAAKDSGSKDGADLSNYKFERQEDLNLFRDLKKRVLPSADDRAEKTRLMQDTELLRALQALLQAQNLGEETLKNQNVALDLLVEAAQNQSPEATAVLQAVVMDPQIENASIPQAARENLAGIKAEVLYQWSAVNPKATSQLQAMLPGPVSQKIWENVVARQRSNVAESTGEIKSK